MKNLFSEQALLTLREEIARAEGNEVFFLGRTDEFRIVTEIEAVARGNRDAVAAVMVAASFGDVAVHNHPSGNLTPSNADIEVSSVLGNLGVGFYIVDNDGTRCNQVVPPFARREAKPLSYPEIERFFGTEGPLAASLDGFEHREEQVRMAFAAAEAFNGNRIALIEAGTGTGKSLAYLVPALTWAVANKERVVVSTNTINLQEQLTRKDLPLLAKRLPAPFRAVLVKGRSNYLCLRKLETVKAEPALFPDEAGAELQAILEWSGKTAEGCRNDLSFIPKDEVWEEVACEADQCTRARCPHYAKCFFYSARREAAGADLLVVNHALLMADVAVRAEAGAGSSGVLPPFDRLIFDEGHHLEEVATSHLSAQVSRQGLLKLLGRLQHPRKQQRGLLPLLSTRLSKDIPEELDDLYMEISGILETVLVPERSGLADAVSRGLDAVAFALLEHLNAGDRTGEFKLRVAGELYGTEFWGTMEERLRDLSRRLATYATAMKNFAKACEKLPQPVVEKLAGPLVDLKGIRGRLESAAADLTFFISRDEGFCRWFEAKRGGKGLSVRLSTAPLEVAETVKRVILDRFKTVIVTSATLAVGERFDYLKDRTGVSLADPARVTELLLPSPFDYANQAFVGIPADIPEPTDRRFGPALEEHLLKALTISGGRAFVLFTSYDLMGKTYSALARKLEALGLTPMRQGEINRHLLLGRFRKERNPVLFGTDSFWEGVDVKGKGLELVVITRLPFRVPTEPVLEARAESLAARGGDPFREYTVPQAVIRFKQGFGRLIRHRDDRGGVLILDSRVLSKPYGRFFLKSLPDVRLAAAPGDEVYRRMADFFATDPTSSASPKS
jgi:ATP-dependent DNA helicase DinG